MSDTPVVLDEAEMRAFEEFRQTLYPLDRPPRAVPPADSSRFIIHQDRPKQLIAGLGFEIMSDSIGSGNVGLPEEPLGVPHDLVPAERLRLCNEMLHGFRYCRLAGGLYWRGLDAEMKTFRPRWPEQLSELSEMLVKAGIEGVSLEYWSPAPYWKANRKLFGGDKRTNRLRCFAEDFANDPDYRGDVERFLDDFAAACRADIETLNAAGVPVVMWGLQAEPFSPAATFPACVYDPEDYARAFRRVAPTIRAVDSRISIVADTSLSWQFPFIRSVLDDPESSHLVDILAIHLIGCDSRFVRPPTEPSGKPRINNEFEYLFGPTTPARCLNSVQVIMNWFQLADAPTWFWIHALKPYGNEEASGYSLGLWRPSTDSDNSAYPDGLQPGHWNWNRYNWYAVGSFLRHMPWDCRSLAASEVDGSDDDLRICAFRRPDGKLVVTLSNRSFRPHTFQIETGIKGTFRGWRYSPESAGADFSGEQLGAISGSTLAVEVPDMCWEFWEEE